MEFDVEKHNAMVENIIIKEGFDDIKAKYDWLQSQVIVLEEGSEPMVGDIVVAYDTPKRVFRVTEDDWEDDYGSTQGHHTILKILARISPTDGKLKAVVYKKKTREGI